jgi:hypothetical protein
MDSGAPKVEKRAQREIQGSRKGVHSAHTPESGAFISTPRISGFYERMMRGPSNKPSRPRITRLRARK